MKDRLLSVGANLRTFLSSEDVHLGFSASAKAHLNRFRYFLEGYFFVELGNYPSPIAAGTGSTFPQTTYNQMYTQFKNLYEYLVDNGPAAYATLASGGICVLQNVHAFDQRHGYEPQIHMLPLLPGFTEEVPQTQAGPRVSPNSFKIRSDQMKPSDRLITMSLLLKATNSVAPECPLVR